MNFLKKCGTYYFNLARQLFWYFYLFEILKTKGNGMNRIEETKSLFSRRYRLVGISCCLDLLHDGVDTDGTSWVDCAALLLTGHTANVGSDVVQDGGGGDIENISLAEGGGNGEFIFL